MLMTSARPASRPAPGLPAPPVRPERSDRLPRWAVAVAIAGLPLLIPPGPSNTAPADVFIVIAIGATLLWAASTRQLVKFPYVVGVGTMVVAGCVAAVFGKYPHEGALAVAHGRLPARVGHHGGQCGPDRGRGRVPDARVVRDGEPVGVGLLAFVGHHAASSGTATAEAARASFTLGEQNGAGFYFTVTIMMILAARCPRRLWCGSPSLACLTLDTFLTGSLAAMSGLIAALGLALVVRTATRQGGAAALVLFLVLAVVAVGGERLISHYQVVQQAQSSQNLLLRNSVGRAHQSIWDRQVITYETLGLWRTSTLVGLGPNATKSTLKAQQAPYPKEAHDDWTASLVERGIVGFAGLLLLVAEIIWRASRVGSPRRLGPGLAAGLPAPEFLVGAFATMAVYSFTHQILHDRTAWTLLGVLAAFSLWRMQARWPGPDATGPVTSRGTQ